ncbi:phosphate ABC transporter permease subunit PstC [Candidatus Lokiarchaeum ossiferum]|uniref:phosphate ABC transporter permease subunit PstC n=1 Tax=Candidatus Lokiarchaeum ossiferum TaxID=2951803 RepID=UPI00352E135E
MSITKIQGPKSTIQDLVPNHTFLMKKELFIDKIIKNILIIAAFFSTFVVFAQIIFFFNEASGTFQEIPASEFIFSTRWRIDLDTEANTSYGSVPLIYGSLATTLLAMLIAVPVGVSTAIFISEMAPTKIKDFIKGSVEVLAGIPSIVWGSLGMTVLNPLIINLFNRPMGDSWLSGSVILSIMALPTIVSVSEDAIESVPISFREASLGVGANKWHTISNVVLPSASSGITTAIILGIGRAIGETMAILLITGANPIVPDPLNNIWSPISTITATIAKEFPETVFRGTHYKSLISLAIILFIIVIVINTTAEFILSRIQLKFNPKTQVNYEQKLNDIQKNCKVGKQTARNKWETEFVTLQCKYQLWKERNSFRFSKIKHFWNKYNKYLGILILTLFVYAMAINFTTWWGALIFIILMGFCIYIFSDRLNIKLKQSVAFTLIRLTVILVIAVLSFVVGYIVYHGLPYMTRSFLLEFPSDIGRDGGILPAIIGTLLLTVGSVIVAVPLGVLAGIYLSEYAKDTPLTRIIRTGIDILNGTPSIVFGLFGWVFFIYFIGVNFYEPMRRPTLLAGILTLSLMILPTIIRTTEESVKSIPQNIREGSYALGATKWKTINKTVMKPASPGIITGVILSMGRSAGETAPIMFTAATLIVYAMPDTFLGILLSPTMSLSYHLYALRSFIPGQSQRADATTFVLLILVLFLYLIAMFIRSKIKKQNKTNFHY